MVKTIIEKTKVENLKLAAYNLPTKILGCLLLLSDVLIGGWVAYEVSSFTALQFATLFVALAVSILLSQHQFTIPSTKTTINARDLVVAWGTLWLGIPGGVLLAAGISVVQYRQSSKDKTGWLFKGLINAVSIFAAAVSFYFLINKLTGFSENVVAEHQIAAGWLILLTIILVLVYRLFSTVLTAVFLKLENPASDSLRLLKTKPVWLLENAAFGTISALIVHSALIEFGLLFGIVILLMTVVAHYAYFIHNARLALKTKEISEASRVHLATVEVLATAIDARDQIGTGHVRRTQIYAVGIGEIMELSSNDLEALSTGALLHDIGKLAVPDHILNKPGRLTPAEMEKIKIHAPVGASILEKVDFSYPVVPTVKYHHEAWDGSGYPEGLKGENIPLTARILAVADAFDTLRGARPYRPAITREEARKFLINGAGTQFDQNVVDVFLRNLKKLEAEITAQGLYYILEKNDTSELPVVFDDQSDQSYVEQIKRANQEVYTLYELSRVFSSSLNLHDTLSLLVTKIGELVPFDTCVVYLMDESQEFAETAYVKGENKPAFKHKRIKTGDGATGFVLKKKQSVCKIKPSLDFTFSETKPDRDYSAMGSLPLIIDEKILGAVSLYSFDLKTYEEEHMRLLETVSRIASDALGMAIQHAESENRALTDPMTDLPNARSLKMQFEKETARASRNGSSFQVLMLDLDGFKAVNDTFGHNIGDKLLKEIALVLRGQLRDYDFLARYAGDEFVAIVPEITAEEVEDLRDRMEKAVFDFMLPVDEDNCARVGISIGSACYPNNGETLDKVVVAADKAMYAVKAVRKKKIADEKLPLLAEIIEADDFTDENFIVELDESHIISSAIN